jgi:hypothetical protein
MLNNFFNELPPHSSLQRTSKEGRYLDKIYILIYVDSCHVHRFLISSKVSFFSCLTDKIDHFLTTQFCNLE